MENKKIDANNFKAGLGSFHKSETLKESFDGLEKISAKKSFDGADQNNNNNSSQTNDEEKPKYQIAPDHS